MKNNLAFTKTDKIMQIRGSILFIVKYMVVKAKFFLFEMCPKAAQPNDQVTIR